MSLLPRTFPAKLLLFGEYTILSGSQALAIPLPRWKGSWEHGSSPGDEDAFMKAYLHWLETMHLIRAKDAEGILQDMREGWRYTSDIPIGYGLGSSGAFVAALYDRYLKNPNSSPDDVWKTLAGMEGYFHGTSSGMDPMVSFSQQAVYKDDLSRSRTVNDPGWPGYYNVFLLDSGYDRATAPLVQQYKAKWQQDEWKRMVERELIPVVDHAIHFYLSGEGDMLAQCLSVISQFQRQHFAFLIPDPIQERWDTLVSQPGVYVKLCGAGGGGFFLVVQTQPSASPPSPELIRINSTQ